MKHIKKLNTLQIHDITVPCSKSYLNRALIIASCVDGMTHLTQVCEPGEDVLLMIEALQQLGIKIETRNNSVKIHGKGGKFVCPENGMINCGIAGTTSRFIIGLSMLFDFDIIITGEGKMLERPIGDLTHSMKTMGAHIEYLQKDGTLPIKVYGKKNTNCHTLDVSGSKSSQFLTSLLMVSSCLHIHTINIVDELVSKSYIDMTLEIIKAFGIDIVHKNYKSFHIPANQKYNTPGSYAIEVDWSGVSYFFALKYLMKAPWNITGLNTHSLQGDAQFVKIIEAFQTHTSQELILDMGSMPDTSMTAMIIAAFENFNTVITNVSTLKDKECNRLQAMHDELKKVGIKTEIAEDWNAITIHGNPHISLTHPIEIETHHDHRIAMCFAILGAKTGNIFIKNPEVVKKSFINFWEVFERLYTHAIN